MTEILTETQRERYSRQLLVDSFDEADQRTLSSSSALVVGAGGLGSPAIQYLAAAGVGTVGVVDDGTVKLSNLQRQVIHGVDDVGDDKVDSAARFVTALNPDVTIEKYPTRLDPDIAPSIVEGYDVVVDGLDSFPARFLLNDTARVADVPFVHGAVYGYEGQASTFIPGGPCYRCLLPSVPEPETAPSGEPMGIFPTVPGTVGTIQATETLKLLLDTGKTLDGRILRYDATDVTVVTTPLDRDPDCPVCGSGGIDSIEGVDYDGDCRIDR